MRVNFLLLLLLLLLLHIVYCILYIVYYILYKLFIIYCIMYIIYCILYIVINYEFTSRIQQPRYIIFYCKCLTLNSNSRSANDMNRGIQISSQRGCLIILFIFIRPRLRGNGQLLN